MLPLPPLEPGVFGVLGVRGACVPDAEEVLGPEDRRRLAAIADGDGERDVVVRCNPLGRVERGEMSPKSLSSSSSSVIAVVEELSLESEKMLELLERNPKSSKGPHWIISPELPNEGSKGPNLFDGKVVGENTMPSLQGPKPLVELSPHTSSCGMSSVDAGVCHGVGLEREREG